MLRSILLGKVLAGLPCHLARLVDNVDNGVKIIVHQLNTARRLIVRPVKPRCRPRRGGGGDEEAAFKFFIKIIN